MYAKRGLDMIIDFHAHAFPDSLAPRAMQSLVAGCGIQPCTDGTISGLKENMKNAGVDISVILPVATKPSQVDSINGWMAQINDPMLIPFGAVHPDTQDYMKVMYDLKSTGIKGVKLHPEYQYFYVDDKRVFPMYEAFVHYDMIVVLHSGVDIGLPPPVHCTPERLRTVAFAFPSMKIVASHMGAYDLWDDVLAHLPDTGVWIDTSYTTMLDAGMYKRLLDKFDIQKVLFGSDSPWEDPSLTIAHLNSLNLSSDAYEKIYYKNALKLLEG
jgi:predicted TIM-barrel fold metal-dependent hydrolase